MPGVGTHCRLPLECRSYERVFSSAGSGSVGQCGAQERLVSAAVARNGMGGPETCARPQREFMSTARAGRLEGSDRIPFRPASSPHDDGPHQGRRDPGSVGGHDAHDGGQQEESPGHPRRSPESPGCRAGDHQQVRFDGVVAKEAESAPDAQRPPVGLFESLADSRGCGFRWRTGLGHVGRR